jgi:hypothetical protein
MHKYTGRLTVVCAAVGLALAPGAAMAKKPKYPIPPVKGGTTSTKSAATTAATSLQKTTGKTLASKGLKVKVTFTSAGKITITVKGGGKTIGSGSATDSKAGTKTVDVKFSAAGKTFLKTGAGKKVTVTVTFKPTTGKSSTSTSTVKLG